MSSTIVRLAALACVVSSSAVAKSADSGRFVIPAVAVRTCATVAPWTKPVAESQ